jgi:hypothetical protein
VGLEALLILFFFVLPGLMADTVFRFLLWRPEPKEGATVARAILFSGAGLLTVWAIRLLVDVSPPLYVFPSWWRAAAEGNEGPVGDIVRSWGVHTVAAIVVALLLTLLLSQAWAAKAIRKLTGQSLFDSAWQEFLEHCFGEYVLVRTTGGRSIYGQLGVVSGHGDRSIVIWNPADYERTKQGEVIEVTPTKALYLPESEIREVLVSYSKADIAAKGATFGRYYLATGEKLP